MRALLLVLFLCACGPTPPKPTPRPPLDSSSCDAACAHLRELQCEEGFALQDGTSCEQFCHDTQDSGHALNPACVLTIRTCSELDSRCAMGY